MKADSPAPLVPRNPDYLYSELLYVSARARALQAREREKSLAGVFLPSGRTREACISNCISEIPTSAFNHSLYAAGRGRLPRSPARVTIPVAAGIIITAGYAPRWNYSSGCIAPRADSTIRPRGRFSRMDILIDHLDSLRVERFTHTYTITSA